MNPARLELGIYDPSYFTDIKLAENTPVVLVGAPKRCRLFLERQSWTQISNKVIVFAADRVVAALQLATAGLGSRTDVGDGGE